MMSLLRKYNKILVFFFAALLSVIFSNTVFAQQPQMSTSDLNGGVTVANSLPQEPAQDVVDNSYFEFAASHLEPNFYP
jgi:hypothetical protein